MHISSLLFLLLIFFIHPSRAALLSVLVEAYPPFVTEDISDGTANGPYIEAFKKLLQKEGIQTDLRIMPIRRALIMAESTPGLCVLALSYAPAQAEVLLYLGKVAPIYIWAYARHEDKIQLQNLAELKKYKVATVDMAEVRQILEENAIYYYTLPMNTSGLQMLLAKRFDILLSDVIPELTISNADAVIDRVFTVTGVDRWLACNASTDPSIFPILKRAIREGLFSNSVQDVWEKYRMGHYFKEVRQKWSVINNS